MCLNTILNKAEITKEDLVNLLQTQGSEEMNLLFRHADAIRKEYMGDEVHVRGIIDYSNHCSENCLYCSLREDNFTINRYRMSPDEIIETAKKAYESGVRTILLKSGQESFFDTDIISYIIYTIKNKFDVAVTICLGKRSFDEYKAWKIAGADRYLLSFETSNSKLYQIYHKGSKLVDRINHIKYLKHIGYQIGSGSIIGLPMQKLEDIANDIFLLKELNIDMAVFSPFIPKKFTPYQNEKPGGIDLLFKTMAAARIVLKDAHITVTSAVQSIQNDSGISGLNAGANILMHDVTPHAYKIKNLLPGPEFQELSDPAKLNLKLESAGRSLSFSRGDSIKSIHN